MKGKQRKEGPEKDSAGAGVEAKAEAGVEEAAKPPEAPAVDERLLRLQADFENFRKRTQREKSEIHQRATEDLMRELLSVLDHLDLALDSAVQHHANGPVIEGVKLVCEQLLGALRKFGLTPVEATNEEFDPLKHEAISQISTPGVPANRVVTQVRRGYMLGSRLLRPAQVVVSTGPAPAEGETPPAEG